MKIINGFFIKYHKCLKPPQTVVVRVFIQILKEEFGLVLRSDKVDYKVSSRIIYVNSSGVMKQEVLLRKQEVLEKLRINFSGHESPVDIV